MDINRADYSINCPECKVRVNKAQNDVSLFIQSITGIAPDQNNKKLIAPLELDIVVKKDENTIIAFEYCGAIWHSTKYKSNEKYHQEKRDICDAKNIRLITMFDDEWLDKQDICKSRIRNILGVVSTKIAARKCDIQKIGNDVALSFCDKNHIQGKGKANHSYGLFYDTSLVSVMTFSTPSLAKGGDKKDYDWELNRFCSQLDTVVIGGASRLFAAFRSEFPNDCIVSFCDLRWGDGTVYEKLGFILLYRTDPNYYYVGKFTDWKRKHRFGFTKQNLIEMFQETDTTLTEKEIAEKNGLFRMYDCGHLKFIINPKK
jgi:hypothetical protein